MIMANPLIIYLENVQIQNTNCQLFSVVNQSLICFYLHGSLLVCTKVNLVWKEKLIILPIFQEVLGFTVYTVDQLNM